MDNSSPELFYDLHTEIVICCGTVSPNRKMMGKGIGQKMKLKQGDTGTRVSCNMTAIVWKDKLYGSILTNMLLLPAEGNFCDEHGKSNWP
jgi:hypothetical protein